VHTDTLPYNLPKGVTAVIVLEREGPKAFRTKRPSRQDKRMRDLSVI